MHATALFRQALVHLLIAASLVAPLRTVFACQLMDGRRLYRCCCHEQGHCRHGGGCPHRKQGGGGGCCDISHDVADAGLAAPTDGPGCHLTVPTWHALLPALGFILAPSSSPATPRLTTGPPPLFAANDPPPYLRTLRLRI